jgi:hypothetical protein
MACFYILDGLIEFSTAQGVAETAMPEIWLCTAA